MAAGTAFYFFSPGQDGKGPLGVLKRAPSKTLAFWPAQPQLLAGPKDFGDPFGVALGAREDILVSDGERNRIMLLADGQWSTLAGGDEGYADGLGSQAAFHTPSALARDTAGNVYVADTGNHAIRKITPDGMVSTLAGGNGGGYADGPGKQARFFGPVGVAVDVTGVVYVADTYNDRIRRIDAQGNVTTIAGNGQPALLDGAALEASFDTPSALVLDTDGSLIVADTGNHALRRVAIDGSVSTMAAPNADEKRPQLRRPVALALTHDGYLYISASGGGRILQRTPEGELQALPDATRPLDPNGFGSDGTLQLYGPRGIGVARDGSLVVAEASAHRLLRLKHAREGQPATPLALPAPQLRTTPMPWPVAPQDSPHEVVGVMGEVRGAYNGDARDHFHAGLDVRADVGARVLAIEATKVLDPYPNWAFGNLGEGLNLESFSYIHMRVGRDPQGRALDPRFTILRDGRGKAERVRVMRGTRFGVGDALGTINAMAHVHLDYYQNGAVVNGLTLPLIGFTDNVTPVIDRIALYDSAQQRLSAPKGQPIRLARTGGPLHIVVNAWDQVDGNLARRKLGLYRLGYQVLYPDGSPVAGFEAPVITQLYDRLPRNPDAVKLAYAPTSGITVYGSKSTQFDYAVTNRMKGGEVEPGVWAIDQLEAGDYILRIHAADFAGHLARQGRDLRISIE